MECFKALFLDWEEKLDTECSLRSLERIDDRSVKSAEGQGRGEE